MDRTPDSPPESPPCPICQSDFADGRDRWLVGRDAYQFVCDGECLREWRLQNENEPRGQ